MEVLTQSKDDLNLSIHDCCCLAKKCPKVYNNILAVNDLSFTKIQAEMFELLVAGKSTTIQRMLLL